jgi:hypothetical protein
MLHVRSDAKPVKQPLRRLSEEKRRIIGKEIARLLAAGFIMEVFFPEWLANPVLVLKKNNKWRMCIDYTSLNKACPKDPFALPLSWYSQGGGCETTDATGWLKVRARLPLEYPRTGMRVARASLPRFGALRRDNTPTPACLNICGLSGTECSWSYI